MVGPCTLHYPIVRNRPEFPEFRVLKVMQIYINYMCTWALRVTLSQDVLELPNERNLQVGSLGYRGRV